MLNVTVSSKVGCSLQLVAYASSIIFVIILVFQSFYMLTVSMLVILHYFCISVKRSPYTVMPALLSSLLGDVTSIWYIVVDYSGQSLSQKDTHIQRNLKITGSKLCKSMQIQIF